MSGLQFHLPPSAGVAGHLLMHELNRVRVSDAICLILHATLPPRYGIGIPRNRFSSSAMSCGLASRWKDMKFVVMNGAFPLPRVASLIISAWRD